jgi:hypothetical protein
MAVTKKAKSLEERLREIVEKKAVEQIANAPKLIDSLIQRSLLSLLGLEARGYGDIQIDHCNGRNSVLIDAFRSQAEESAKKIAAGYKPTKEELASFDAAFKKEFSRQMSRAIDAEAHARAQTEAKAFIEKITVDVGAILAEKI